VVFLLSRDFARKSGVMMNNPIVLKTKKRIDMRYLRENRGEHAPNQTFALQ
jgi:hypothetical protein